MRHMLVRRLSVEVSVWLVLGAPLTGCGEGADTDDASPQVPTSSAKATASSSESARAGEGGWEPSLRAAVARGVVPPTADDATYRVDAFVAALVFEHVQRTRGVPYFSAYTSGGEDGRPTAGYQLGEVESDSIFASLGLRSGDVIDAINGVALTGPDRLGFALDGAENRVTVSVFRDDVFFTLSYRLDGGLAWRDALASYTGEAQPEQPPEPVDAPEDPPGTDPNDPAPPSSPPPSRGASKGPEVARPSSPSPSSGGGARPSPSRPSAPASPAAAGSVRCSTASRCTIDEAYFRELVATPERLQSQVQVVPAIRNDVFSGYKLKSIKAGSAASRLGFRPGDKITHINGKDLTDDAQALQVYLGLSATRIFKIRFERGGRSSVKTVLVQ